MRVMVLNDEQTFSDLAGCKIVSVARATQPDAEDVEAAIRGDRAGATVEYIFTGGEPVPLDGALLLSAQRDLRAQIKFALEGDSNDAEHDALASVAAVLGIDYTPEGGV